MHGLNHLYADDYFCEREVPIINDDKRRKNF